MAECGGTGFDYNALAAAANAGITPALEGIGGDTKAMTALDRLLPNTASMPLAML